MTNRITKENCAHCGAVITRGVTLFDEYIDGYYCDMDCFEEWADHTQKPLEYYARHNVSKVDRS